MKCTQCGAENHADALFCVNCGSSLIQTQQVGEVLSAPSNVLEMLKDRLFLIICILFSIGYGLQLIDGNFNIIGILVIVFLWLLYSEVKKDSLTSKNLRNLSGVTYAVYVIMWVAVGILVVCGIIILAFSNAVDLFDVFYEAFRDAGLYIDVSHISQYVNSLVWLMGALIFIIAILGALLNIFCYKKLHSFAQSLYKRVEDGITPIVKVTAARSWLIVLGVFRGLSCILSLGTDTYAALTDGCIATALIMASVLIKKYISEDSTM